MQMVRLSTSLQVLDQVAEFVGEQSSPVALAWVDADSVVAAGGLKDRWFKPIGVWLEVGEGYPASLAARDVATLSWLIELDHVIVSGPDAALQAQVVRAMLVDDEVSFTNEVATILGAFNRPAPPRELRVWSYDGDTLRSGEDELRAGRTQREAVGDVTVFS